MFELNLHDTEHIGNCACGNLRKTTRIMSQFYDKNLQSTGLRGTQFILLADISVNENISVNELADMLLMDQTTVTRNIEILRKKGYINVRKGDDDSRRKCISLSESGEEKLNESIPLWRNAQEQIEQGLGAERLEELLKTLEYIQNLI